MEVLFAAAFGMSIAFAAQPGVIGFEAVRRGVARGWRAALHLELGSLVGDATWSLLALVGASVLFQNRVVAILLSLFGCFLLLRFAHGAWQASRHESAMSEAARMDGRGDFAAGAALSLSNPSNLTFWLGMSGTVIGLGFLDPEPAHLAIFFSGFMLAQVLWCFFFAGLVGIGRRFITPAMFRRVNAVCALLLAYLGLQTLFTTVQMMLVG